MAEAEQKLLEKLNQKLADKILQVQATRNGKIFVNVKAEACKEAVNALLEESEAGISAITGIDLGSKIGVMYHIRLSGTIVTLKVETNKENAKVATITDIAPSADFHEREVADLFGVKFEGHPNTKRLVLPDTWPQNLYPLRKDVETINLASSLETLENLYDEEDSSEGGNVIKVIVGPQHPALLEPEKFSLEVDVETVKKVTPRLGYVHRGIEKATEKRTYLQNIYLVERICGICNACHAACFCQTLEELLGLTIPPRANYLRAIILELNRIHSHMLLLGHTGIEIGYETLFHYMWRDREQVMDIVEMLTGNRVLASFITIGGVRRDLEEKIIPKIKAELTNLRSRLPFYRKLFENDATIKSRTKNVGVLSKNDALKLGVVGPVARGSGLKMDVRKDEPYAAYGEIPFKLITYDEGDTWSRLMVRLDEINESINIIEYALEHLPTGSYRVRAPRIVPEGEAVDRVEAPRGELFYYVKSNGTAYPERVKVRTPTFANIPSFIRIALGSSIADVPAIFASLDPCFSCTDR